jgi:hypothetical protein
VATLPPPGDPNEPYRESTWQERAERHEAEYAPDLAEQRRPDGMSPRARSLVGTIAGIVALIVLILFIYVGCFAFNSSSNPSPGTSPGHSHGGH